jgi:hypothetical protein
MGLDKRKRPGYFPQGVQIPGANLTLSGNAGVVNPVQSVTSTASTVSSYGLTIVTMPAATADKVISLARPAAAGLVKGIVCNATGTQKITLTLAGATATGFFVGGGGNAAGSTYRSIVFSSLSTKVRTVTLMSASTVAWALIAKSTGTTLSG